MDGAIADSIPLRFMERSGCEKNIVILTQPAGFLKHPSKFMGLLRLVYRKYPAFVRAMEQRHEHYNETVNYVEAQAALGNVLLLRPEHTLPISRICRDRELLTQTYELGREHARKHLAELKSFTASRKPS